MSLVLWGALVAWLGVGILPYLVIQAVVGFSLLEVVNYMEHYGMLRQKVGVGERQRYERVDPTHSWNSNNIATNVLLYHLQRHSDHHANPTRRYQSLRDFEESPVLPTGYAGMIVLADRPRRLAPGDGPAGARALRRRPVAGQPRRRASGTRSWRSTPPPVVEEVAQQPSRHLDRRGRRRGAGRPLPRLRLHLRVEEGDEHEGFAAGTAWADVPDGWCCPDCGVREKVDFVPLTEAAGRS